MRHSAMGGSLFSRVRSVVRGNITADELLRPDRYGVEFPEDSFPPRRSHRAEYRAAVEQGYEAAAKTTLAVGVLIYNRIDLIDLLRARLHRLAGLFRRASVYLVAEDSTDGTAEVARQWNREEPESLRLVPPPTRKTSGAVARIAMLRNALLEAMEAGPPSELVCMLDGDLEGPLSLDGVAHTMALFDARPELSAVAAFGINNWVGFDNSLPFLGYTYYDPLAFREDRWERASSDALTRWRLGFFRRGDRPLEVKSGFAGCAIYRSAPIRGLRYPEKGSDCEHVDFHRALAQRGGTLAVNPSMLLLAGAQGHHEQQTGNREA